MANIRLLRLKSDDVLPQSSPQNLADFVGQSRVKNYVKELILGASRLGRPLPHLLILGPSGCGKTTMAALIAKEVGSKFLSMTASPDYNRNDLCEVFENFEQGDVFYIDETHSLNPDCQQLLFQFLDTGTIPRSGEKKPDVAARPVHVKPITLVLSTNHPGGLRKELMNRLIRIELDDYSQDDLKKQAFQILEPERSIALPALDRLTEAAHGSPRYIVNALRELYYIAPTSSRFDSEHVESLFRNRRVGPKGLDNYCLRILSFLAAQPEATARLGVLADRLGLDRRYLQREVEPTLIRLGLLAVTPMGRSLSRRGKLFVDEHMN